MYVEKSAALNITLKLGKGRVQVETDNSNNHFLFSWQFQVSFEEVLGEPDHTHSIDCVWKCSYKCFNLWKNLCYTLATLLCGICFATFWGCEFAEVAFWHIWYYTPLLRYFEVNIKMIGKFYTVCVQACCDPCFESCGLLFKAFKK